MAGDPYLICTVEDLVEIREVAVEPNSYRLANDLEFGDDLFDKDGDSPGVGIGSEASPYRGVFDGDGKEIRGAHFQGGQAVGLFRYVGESGEIRNLSLVDVDSSGESDVGGLVGRNSGIIEAVDISGEVFGSSRVGLLAGTNEGSILDSAVVGGRVSAGATSDGVRASEIGGMVGQNTGVLDEVYVSLDELTVSPGSSAESRAVKIGGLVGTNYGDVIEATAATFIWSPNGNIREVGGLVGSNGEADGSPSRPGTILNSHVVVPADAPAGESVTFSVNGADQVGGIAGFNRVNSTIQESSTSVGVSGNARVGGFVGQNEGSALITDSWAEGPVSGGANVGGFVGWHTSAVPIQDCHATGDVDGGDSVGGFVGFGDGQGRRVEGVHAAGRVTGSRYVGGLGGQIRGFVEDSFASGDVHGEEQVGGLVGLAGLSTGTTSCGGIGAIINSHASGDVFGVEMVGGLVGRVCNRGVQSSYSTGTVEGWTEVGGLVGEFGYDDWAFIHDSYSTSSVVNLDSGSGGLRNGGLIGVYRGMSANCNAAPTIQFVYAAGEVSGGTSSGGLIGERHHVDECPSTGIMAAYWDNETTGQINGVGIGAEDGVNSLSTTQFSSQSYFHSDWDFENIWTIAPTGETDTSGDPVQRPLLFTADIIGSGF